MARFPIHGFYQDGAGNMVVSGSATFYEYKAADPTNPDTIATIYTAKTGGSAVATGIITTDSNGAYLAWIDDSDYAGGQIFTLILSKSTHRDVPVHFGVYGLSFKDTSETLTNKKLTSPVLTTPQIDDTSEDHQYVVAVSELSADRTITFPQLTANDTFVFANFVQTLTGKKIGDPSTPTKAIAFTLSGATSAKTLTLISAHSDDRSITFPNVTTTLVGHDNTQTLSAKTLITPTIAATGFTNMTHPHEAANTGGVLSGPSFNVHKGGSNQTAVVTATWTQVTWATEVFDTATAFASHTFTPQVAGKYILMGAVEYTVSASAKNNRCGIYKNNALVHAGFKNLGQNTVEVGCSVCVIVDANGSTDNFELWAYQDSGGDKIIDGTANTTWFMGGRMA